MQIPKITKIHQKSKGKVVKMHCEYKKNRLRRATVMDSVYIIHYYSNFAARRAAKIFWAIFSTIRWKVKKKHWLETSLFGSVINDNIGWGVLLLVKLLNPCFLDMGGVGMGSIASNTLKYILLVPEDAYSSPQYPCIAANAINPLSEHIWLKPGTVRLAS